MEIQCKLAEFKWFEKLRILRDKKWIIKETKNWWWWRRWWITLLAQIKIMNYFNMVFFALTHSL